MGGQRGCRIRRPPVKAASQPNLAAVVARAAAAATAAAKQSPAASFSASRRPEEPSRAQCALSGPSDLPGDEDEVVAFSRLIAPTGNNYSGAVAWAARGKSLTGIPDPQAAPSGMHAAHAASFSSTRITRTHATVHPSPGFKAWDAGNLANLAAAVDGSEHAHHGYQPSRADASYAEGGLWGSYKSSQGAARAGQAGPVAEGFRAESKLGGGSDHWDRLSHGMVEGSHGPAFPSLPILYDNHLFQPAALQDSPSMHMRDSPSMQLRDSPGMQGQRASVSNVHVELYLQHRQRQGPAQPARAQGPVSSGGQPQTSKRRLRRVTLLRGSPKLKSLSTQVGAAVPVPCLCCCP